MIWEANLHLLAAIGGIATLIWMAERRIYATAGLSFGAWALIAYSAAEIRTHTMSGEVVTREGQYIQVAAIFLSALSLLAIISTYFDHYPPEEDDEL